MSFNAPPSIMPGDAGASTGHANLSRSKSAPLTGKMANVSFNAIQLPPMTPTIKKYDPEHRAGLGGSENSRTSICGNRTSRPYSHVIAVVACIVALFGILVGLETHLLVTSMVSFLVFASVLFGLTILLCDLQASWQNSSSRRQLSSNDLTSLIYGRKTTPRIFMA